MQSKGHSLQNLDLVVQTLTGAVGTAILPGVLNVASPMADTVG